MKITAKNIDFKTLNEQIRSAGDEVCVEDCCGQRFIACGSKSQKITLHGTPGNALGAYLDGGTICVHGNAQDAIGDTMNGGKIIIHGNAGDALGYAMRGGEIIVRGNVGYRAGIHMKEYKEKKPVMIIGGNTGSFLGEYLAGGIIVVLGLQTNEVPVGNFTGTGMHGGKIFIRTQKELKGLPEQVVASVATTEELSEIVPYIEAFSKLFGYDANAILNDRYCLLSPNAKNPYKQLYAIN